MAKIFFFLIASVASAILLSEQVSAQSLSNDIGLPVDPPASGWLNNSGSPYHKGNQLHALDLVLAADPYIPRGYPVFSILDGEVREVYSNPTEGCGYGLEIWHKSYNVSSRYCHFEGWATAGLSPGASITKGTPLGFIGSTGAVTCSSSSNCDPSHLHFSVFRVDASGNYSTTDTAAAVDTSVFPAYSGLGNGGSVTPSLVGTSGDYFFLASKDGTTPKVSGIPLKLEISYPELPPGSGNILNDFVEGTNVIFLPSIIRVFFQILIWISAIVAFITIVYAGFQYLVSGDNPNSRRDSFDRLRSAFTGAGILLASVIILNLLNPNLTDLNFRGENLLIKGLDDLTAPTAPSADNGVVAATSGHAGAPIPFTDRAGTENKYALELEYSPAVVTCLEDAAGVTYKEDDCLKQHEKEVIQRFQDRGAIIVNDDDETQTSCAAVCMLVRKDEPGNCRDIGTGVSEGQGSDNGGAKAIWDHVIGGNANNPKWRPDNDGIYQTLHSAYNTWIFGEEDLRSRQCLAQYVKEAADGANDYKWDACFCNEVSAISTATTRGAATNTSSTPSATSPPPST